MPFLLIVFLTLACLPDVGKDWPPPPWNSTPGFAGLITWLSVGLMVGWAWWTAQRTCRALRHDPFHRDRYLRRYERMRRLYQFALFGMYIGVMCLCGWGWAVGKFWTHGPQLILPGAELLILAPFVVAMVLSWVCFYDADRASYLAAHRLSADPLISALLDPEQPGPDAPAAEAGPVFGGRWSYVLFKARSNLLMVFIPLLLLLSHKELYRSCPGLARDWGEWLNLLDFGVVMVVFVCMPWVVRLVLNLKPLPEGPLRRKLLATAQRMHFRCSDILLWNTHGGMANAMVVGMLPWLRYVVFTDRLLEDFTEDEVKAVFGHEMGHVKHHHMFFYMTFLLTSIAALALVVGWLLPDLFNLGAGPQDENGVAAAAAGPGDFLNLSSHQYLRAVPLMLLMQAYIFIVFGFISRRCERQADIYGCRAVSCSQRDCLMHDWNVDLASRGTGLCPTGIRVFIRALEKVAILNGIDRERPGFLQSWQHSTIGRRVGFLQKMLTDGTIEPRFQRRLLLVKCGLFVALGIVLATLVGTGAWLN